jgi:hypothetical protein
MKPKSAVLIVSSITSKYLDVLSTYESHSFCEDNEEIQSFESLFE